MARYPCCLAAMGELTWLLLAASPRNSRTHLSASHHELGNLYGLFQHATFRKQACGLWVAAIEPFGHEHIRPLAMEQPAHHLQHDRC